jgi:hypothetical protein
MMVVRPVAVIRVQLDMSGVLSGVGGGGGGAAQVPVAGAVAVSFEREDFGVVDEPVDHGCGHDVVAEDLAPAPEGHVAGDDQTCALVPGGDQLEKQVRGVGIEGQVSDLVDLC